MATPVRLQRYLAAAGVAARRKAEDLITAGRVTVNGKIVTTLGTKVDPAHDQVMVDGEAVVPLDYFYVLFNKPKGCITAVTDDRGRMTVMDYLPNLPVPVKPVGRLDFYTEGVLLLTNDGELAARLLAPASHVPKTYHVKVHGQLRPDQIKRLREGVQLDDGTTTLPAEIEVLPGESKHTWLAITIHEGKHRQIHRMIEALGHRVDKLQRVAFANLTFHHLRVGDARELTQQELNELRDLVELDHSAVSRGKWRSKREQTDIPRRARTKAIAEAEEAAALAAERRAGDDDREDAWDWAGGDEASAEPGWETTGPDEYRGGGPGRGGQERGGFRGGERGPSRGERGPSRGGGGGPRGGERGASRDGGPPGGGGGLRGGERGPSRGGGGGLRGGERGPSRGDGGGPRGGERGASRDGGPPGGGGGLRGGERGPSRGGGGGLRGGERGPSRGDGGGPRGGFRGGERGPSRGERGPSRGGGGGPRGGGGGPRGGERGPSRGGGGGLRGGERGPSRGERGPSRGGERGPSRGGERGPSRGERGPSRGGGGGPRGGEHGPSRGERGPSRGERASSRGERGPSRGERAPSHGERGPSRGERGPSRGERGPSRGERGATSFGRRDAGQDAARSSSQPGRAGAGGAPRGPQGDRGGRDARSQRSPGDAGGRTRGGQGRSFGKRAGAGGGRRGPRR